ncbi:MAG: cytochrome c [Gammaproteobacteria bacterium]|nr:cytochrome c [Gammaproteobacteria bacterium]
MTGCGDSKPDRAEVAADSAAAAQQAQSLLGAGKAAGGKELFAACQGCHGADGGGMPALNAPTLAGLDAAYLKRQLHNFRTGLRGKHADDTLGAQMAAIAATLPDDAAVDAVVAYIDKLDARRPAATIGGDVKRGADFYSNLCGSCHGPNAEGNALLEAPALAGVDDWYLLRQLTHFRNGVRGVHPQDRHGRQMRIMAPTLPDEAITRDVLAYIGTLKS